MCVKLPSGDLNTGPCPPHSISTCICEVTNAPRVCSGIIIYNLIDTTMGKDMVEPNNSTNIIQFEGNRFVLS